LIGSVQAISTTFNDPLMQGVVFYEAHDSLASPFVPDP